jgi:hypothetical protein
MNSKTSNLADVENAMDELRRGATVVVGDEERSFAVMSVELLS